MIGSNHGRRNRVGSATKSQSGFALETLEQRAMMSFTIQLEAAVLYKADASTPLPLGSTIVLLQDDGDDSFGDLTDGSTFNPDSGDLVLARFGTNEVPGIEGSFQVTLGEIPFVEGSAGRKLLLVWYDLPYNELAAGPGEGVAFNTYRTDSPTADFSSIAWVVPADGANEALRFYTGDFSDVPNPESAGATTQVTGQGSPNTAPVLDPIGNRSVDELSELTFTAAATDNDNPAQTLTFTLDPASIAAGMAIDPATGVFTWTPTEAQGGTGNPFSVTVTVTDNGTGNLTDSETIEITVNEVNQAPVFSAINDRDATLNVELAFTLTATDADLPANTLTYSLDQDSINAGMTIDPATGAFAWTPDQVGDFTVTVTATDDGTGDLADSETFTITVTEQNIAPVLEPVGNRSVDELSELTFTAVATDLNVPAQNLTFTLDQTAIAAGMAINPVTGVFTWTPTEAQGGTGTPFTVTITVTDDGDGDLTDSETIEITVNEVNQAPTLAAVQNQSVAQLSTLTVNLAGDDDDLPAQTLTYSLDQPSLDLGMTINAQTGVITWTPSAQQAPGDVQVTARVTDNGNPALFDEQTFNVTVTDFNDPPTLTSIDVLAGATTRQPFVITYDDLLAASDAADVDSDPVLFRIESVDPTLGVLQKNSANVVVGLTTLSPGEELVWTSTGNTEGTLEAFGVVAFDGEKESDTVVPVDITVARPVVSIQATTPEASEEGPVNGVFTITRTGDTTLGLDLYVARGGTAILGNDRDYTFNVQGAGAFNPTTGMATIAAGQSQLVVTVTPNDDTLIELSESVILSLRPSSAGDFDLSDTVADRSATVSIADNEPTVTIAAVDAAASEAGPGTATFRVTRGGSTVGPLTVYFTRAGNAAFTTDYTLSTGGNSFVVIADGQASADITLTPVADALIEGNETANLSLRPGPDYRLPSDPTQRTAAAVIADNAPVVSIEALEDLAAEEGQVEGTFRISRTGGTTSDLVVTLARLGTASFNSDYTLKVGTTPLTGTTVTIPAGQDHVDITVTPKNDTTAERNETVVLALRTARTSQYNLPTALGDRQATVTIEDNEARVTLETLTEVASEADPAAPAVIRLTRTGDLTKKLVVNLTRTGTATPGAAPRGDFTFTVDPTQGSITAAGTSVTFLPGQDEVTVEIDPVDDAIGEGEESIQFALKPSAAYSVSEDPTLRSSTLTILDNEPVVSIVAVEDTAAEDGQVEGRYRITRTGDLVGDLLVSLKRTGTATLGATADYTLSAINDDGSPNNFVPASNKLTIPDGIAYVDVFLTPIDDTKVESDETATLEVLAVNNAGYSPSPAQRTATVTILDNEPRAFIQTLQDTASESGPTTAGFRVSRTGDPSNELKVNLKLGGAAKVRTDYELTRADDGSAVGTFVIIPAGQTFADVILTPVPSALLEDDEIAQIEINTGPTYSLPGVPADRIAQITITEV